MKNTVTDKTNPRALRILKVLIERYIRDGQPVGSKTLAENQQLALSPASIRNIMADLEVAGYLSSPYTSAGRIPTVKGYRLFVDALLTTQPIQQISLPELLNSLQANTDLRALAETASNTLSNVTQLVSLVTLPRRQRAKLIQVEFLPLSNKRLLVILVLNNGEVQNRIIHVERNLSASQLQQAGNYLTQHFAGRGLAEVRKTLLQQLHRDRTSLERMLRDVLMVAEQAFIDEKDDYILAGEANALNFAEEAGVKHLRSLFKAFTQKRDILHLLDQCLKADGLQIFIGSESGHEAFTTCSLVTAPYKVNGDLVGVLGVIGPTRMEYDRVISTVDVTAKLLSSALADLNN